MFDDSKERVLMDRIAAGDSVAFEELYAIYFRPVSNFLFRMCYDKGLTEDCLQEVFMRVWKSAVRWRGECKVSTFIFQIAKNYGLNARDKAARERARFSDPSAEDEGQGAVVGAPAVGEPEDSGPDPEGALAGAELRDLVRTAVAELPPEQRVVVVLAQTEGLTYREIAQILKLPLGTVKSRMSAGAEALRKKLERHVKA